MVRAKYKPNVLNSRCPSQRVLDLLADKWSVLAIHCHGQGTLRYSDLMRRIGGVSQKMLTQTLRELEENGVVERTVYPVVPPRVDYRLIALLRTLCHWAELHLSQVQAARQRYLKNTPLKSGGKAA